MGGRDDELYYAEEAARDAFIDDAINGISLDNIRSYLGCNGDAISARFHGCLRQAKELFASSYFQSAQVLAVTAIEVLVRFMLIRPLLQGAFLSDEWAYFITQQITSGRSAEDRKLLPRVLAIQSIDIGTLRLPSGQPLWDAIVKRVYPKRNRVIHSAEPVSSEEAQMAIDCAECLYDDIVMPIALKLGFTVSITNCWSKSRRHDGLGGMYFVASDPFVQ
jgi:hypothetical protein